MSKSYERRMPLSIGATSYRPITRMARKTRAGCKNCGKFGWMQVIRKGKALLAGKACLAPTINVMPVANLRKIYRRDTLLRVHFIAYLSPSTPDGGGRAEARPYPSIILRWEHQFAIL